MKILSFNTYEIHTPATGENVLGFQILFENGKELQSTLKKPFDNKTLAGALRNLALVIEKE